MIKNDWNRWSTICIDLPWQEVRFFSFTMEDTLSMQKCWRSLTGAFLDIWAWYFLFLKSPIDTRFWPQKDGWNHWSTINIYKSCTKLSLRYCGRKHGNCHRILAALVMTWSDPLVASNGVNAAPSLCFRSCMPWRWWRWTECGHWPQCASVKLVVTQAEEACEQTFAKGYSHGLSQ